MDTRREYHGITKSRQRSSTTVTCFYRYGSSTEYLYSLCSHTHDQEPDAKGQKKEKHAES